MKLEPPLRFLRVAGVFLLAVVTCYTHCETLHLRKRVADAERAVWTLQEIELQRQRHAGNDLTTRTTDDSTHWEAIKRLWQFNDRKRSPHALK